MTGPNGHAHENSVSTSGTPKTFRTEMSKRSCWRTCRRPRGGFVARKQREIRPGQHPLPVFSDR
jgi:hypothetical protein